MLAELEDLPSQFIGPDSDGLCDLDGIFLRDEDDVERSWDESGFEIRVLPLRLACIVMWLRICCDVETGNMALWAGGECANEKRSLSKQHDGGNEVGEWLQSGTCMAEMRKRTTAEQ